MEPLQFQNQRPVHGCKIPPPGYYTTPARNEERTKVPNIQTGYDDDLGQTYQTDFEI